MNNINKKELLERINKNNKETNVNRYFPNLIKRILVCIILFLTCAIICKSNLELRNSIYNKVYNSNLSFTSIKKLYNKYLGGILPIDNIVEDTEPVFSENLSYKEKSKYLEGVNLTVDTNYLVPILDSGLVVYIGEKEGYNNVVIIQGTSGIDIWYGNMLTTSVKLYDYVEKGNLLGEVDNNNLYLVYSQNGKYLNYADYLE